MKKIYNNQEHNGEYTSSSMAIDNLQVADINNVEGG